MPRRLPEIPGVADVGEETMVALDRGLGARKVGDPKPAENRSASPLRNATLPPPTRGESEQRDLDVSQEPMLARRRSRLAQATLPAVEKQLSEKQSRLDSGAKAKLLGIVPFDQGSVELHFVDDENLLFARFRNLLPHHPEVDFEINRPGHEIQLFSTSDGGSIDIERRGAGKVKVEKVAPSFPFLNRTPAYHGFDTAPGSAVRLMAEIIGKNPARETLLTIDVLTNNQLNPEPGTAIRIVPGPAGEAGSKDGVLLKT